jgi:hypothetical protein
MDSPFPALTVALNIRLSVEAASGDNIESLTFLNIPLTLKGRPDEQFGSCATLSRE